MTDTQLISEKDPIAVALGLRGGQKTSSKYGPDYYRELQKKSTLSKLKRKKNTETTE